MDLSRRKKLNQKLVGLYRYYEEPYAESCTYGFEEKFTSRGVDLLNCGLEVKILRRTIVV